MKEFRVWKGVYEWLRDVFRGKRVQKSMESLDNVGSGGESLMQK